jgi:hypothetical protein
MSKSTGGEQVTEQKQRHKGKFVGGYLTEEQIKKIEAVEKLYDEQFGDVGRNRTRAIRFIVDSFNPEWLSKFPKDLASKSVTA